MGRPIVNLLLNGLLGAVVLVQAGVVDKRQSPPSTLPDNWSYKGCYTDSVAARTLKSSGTAGNDMSAAECIAYCGVRGYALAGTEYSTVSVSLAAGTISMCENAGVASVTTGCISCHGDDPFTMPGHLTFAQLLTSDRSAIVVTPLPMAERSLQMAATWPVVAPPGRHAVAQTVYLCTRRPQRLADLPPPTAQETGVALAATKIRLVRVSWPVLEMSMVDLPI